MGSEAKNKWELDQKQSHNLYKQKLISRIFPVTLLKRVLQMFVR